MNQSIGTPIRVTANGLATGTNVNLSSFTITALAADVNVQFLNGAGGDCLWSAEADASAGSFSHSFPAAIYFSDGIYVQADVPANLESVCLSLV
jgi:hypothetical protein